MTNLAFTSVNETRDRVFRSSRIGGHLQPRWTLELYGDYPVEGAMRVWYHRPRVFRASGIRRITGKAAESDRFVLFVLHTRHTVPAFTETPSTRSAAAVNLVISTNAEITPALRESLPRSATSIERADWGVISAVAMASASSKAGGRRTFGCCSMTACFFRKD